MSQLNTFKLALLTLIVTFFMAQNCAVRLHRVPSGLDHKTKFIYDPNMSTYNVSVISSRKTVAL
jgi:hypothetical protein